jgi:hypothetical protein
MSFNIFGPATTDSIKVGYISTDGGFVDGVSICEANEYAKLNPGTRFVFKNRKYIKYLNINEVNKLTPNDLIVGIDTCEGLQLTAECPPPQAYFYGGGGVGVQGNPVFGSDGSLLAVDLVSGGFGYQYPPIVEVKDGCGIGVGAVTRAVLGEVVETVEVYDQEEDFEDYEICEPTDAGYGNRYGPDGEVLGKWDPTIYTNLSQDPIRREIQEYQDFLQKLSKPWWTTRKAYAPLSVTSSIKTTRTKFDVTDEPFLEKQRKDGAKNPVAWNEFMNTYAISPVPPSNVKGSDFAGIPFTFEWEEDFPYDGEYIFSGLCDNKAEFYLDNIKILDLKQFNDAVNSIKKTLTAGVHRIRLDLLNVPIYETKAIQAKQLPTTPPPELISMLRFNTLDFSGPATATHFYTSDPNDEFIQQNGFVLEGLAFKLFKSSANVPGTVDVYRLFKGIIGDHFFTTSGAEKGSAVLDQYIYEGVVGKAYSEPGPDRIEVVRYFRPSTGEHFYVTTIEDSQRPGWLAGLGYVREGTAFYAPTDPTATPTTEPVAKPTSNPIQNTNVFNTIDYINKANRRLWRTNVYNRGGFLNEYGVCPFDTTVQLDDNPYAGTHTITWNNINFPIDGNYIIELEVDDNVNLTFTGSGGETVITKKGFSGNDRGTGKSTETKFFKAGNYTITANLEQITGGKFGFSGIKGTNPMALAINIQTSFTETQVISAKSWNENPMGIAFTIDAPQPPIPQEPIPLQEGRCPNNPIWTTRFPGAKETWWPVNFNDPNTWSKFTNRYAISPVPPLSTKGSDSGGVVYRNSWDLDVPYDGFYALKSTVDNAGRILIDNVPIMQANYIPTELKNTKGGSGALRRSGISAINGDGIIYNWREENPKAKKIFLSKGKHTIQVEVENGITETFALVDKKIFSTLDWISTNTSPPPPQTIDVQFNAFVNGDYANTFTIDELGIKLEKGRGNSKKSQIFTKTIETGKVYDVKLYSNPGKIKLRTRGDNILQAEDHTDNNWKDIGCSASIGRFFDLNGSQCKFVVDRSTTNLIPTIDSGTLIGGITYEGPQLTSYRSGFISPAYFDGTGQEVMGKTFIMKWTNVDFPEDGQYTLKAEADDLVIVKIDGIEVGRAKVFGGQSITNFNVSKGKRTVELELTNIPGNAQSTFETNPVVAAVIITKKVSVGTGISKPWTSNPIGISAILIPPPCPKRVKGRGVVTDVEVDDPGNGYPAPPGDGYPVSLRLKTVKVEDPGINYNCGVDKIQITPSNGAVLDYVCDTFGRIVEVKILDPGIGFTRYPDITMVSPPGSTPTGINATFRPQFEVVRDPIVIDAKKLIQVTDLVGLKQTGYVDGRAYYGAVFYKDGVRYAGFYETAGDLVQVYDTLQESITARVTTPASAILRQGTDITSNDPRLNIPGTPENFI